MPKEKKAKRESKPKPQPKHRVPEATKEQAQKLTGEVQSLWQDMETSWFGLGAKIKQCIELRVPKALGMSVEVWMEKTIPGSRSRAFRALRIVKALTGVPETKVGAITEGNAYLLARLPEKDRKSEEWINRAMVMPNEKFAEKVEAEIEKKTGLKRDRFEIITLRLPVSVSVLWEKAQKKMARVLQLDTNKSGWRITVIEALAQLVLDTDESRLKLETEGDEGVAEAPPSAVAHYAGEDAP